ncbi:protein adenylyltransferase SelO [Xylophilus sp.]|uniref:protein adenylyltransferase SelO n=1 Tax=Xylophilus sp. TaxID=2653893 RepID=UPI0013BAAD0B|nr:YdiU family protein [Xylophilus sp.]KAF1047825.1 MAG: hypothetical protein GAK38_01768 [Xylophilus sp.]
MTDATDTGLRWNNRFAALGPAFSTTLRPTPLPAPYWVGTSPPAAALLGLDRGGWFGSDASLQALTGNLPIAGSHPLASVYSGHQFGVWAGQLGDGRAILLGETAGGWEVQLKGAGRTPYSRMGDGRAVLRSSIREFLASEAVAGLGIPTTRALCVTGSDAPVYREEAETAAVVTRVAQSFIRFGHFEHFAARDDLASLRTLADYVVDRYYPDCRATPRYGGNAYAALLEAVGLRTAGLLAQWQAVGFCHGVMNTDNMSILGLTIDYGPFQFMDAFNPRHICNHSDTQGRYAFNQQPQVAYWNLLCLAQALLPLIGDEEHAKAALGTYPDAFGSAFDARMRDKLGLPDAAAADRPLIESTLRLLAQGAVDYTIFWRRLADFAAGGELAAVRDLHPDRDAFDAWFDTQYRPRTGGQPDAARIRAANPRYVLRNHLGEVAIRRAREKDFSEVETLRRLLASPYEDHPGFEDRAGFPPDWATSIEISCSS